MEFVHSRDVKWGLKVFKSKYRKKLVNLQFHVRRARSRCRLPVNSTVAIKISSSERFAKQAEDADTLFATGYHLLADTKRSDHNLELIRRTGMH